MLRLTHNAGFFSCCQVRLEAIVQYYNERRRLPIYVDSSQQYAWYSSGRHGKRGPIEAFFTEETDTYVPPPPVTWGTWRGVPQLANMHTIPYEQLAPLVRRYFNPTPEVMRRAQFLQEKYALVPEETCVVFYRGNDKSKEVNLPPYQEMYSRADTTKRVWLQSDETEFLRGNPFPDALVMWDEIRHMPRSQTTVDNSPPSVNHSYALWFLAIVLLMSKCKTVVCGTGNISLWIALFRGNSHGIVQYRSLRDTIYGVPQIAAEDPSVVWCS